MHEKHRKTYFWFIFLTTTIFIPLILLYSSGYRYNLRQHKIIQTGSIFVSAKPTNADVFIDNKFMTAKTPKLFNNLIPNEYAITIRKDGFFNWSKKLTVQSKQTTFADKIILVKSETTPEKIHQANLPPLDASGNLTDEIMAITKQLSLSNDIKAEKNNNGWITILDKKTEQLYLIKNNDTSLKIEKISPQAKNFSWSTANNKKILFYNDLEIWFYDLNSQNAELITRQSEKINEAIWLSDNYVIYSEINKIKLIELDNRELCHSYDLTDAANASDLVLDKEEKNLYFKTEDQYWKLNLLD